MDSSPTVTSLFPTHSREASDFGPFDEGHRAQKDPLALPADPLDASSLHVLCPLPITHAVEFNALWRLGQLCRERHPEAELHLWLRTDLGPHEALDGLPYDSVTLWPRERPPELPFRLLKAAAASPEGCLPCVLIGADDAWVEALENESSLRLLTSLPLERRPLAVHSPGVEATARFQEALREASPRWIHSQHGSWPITFEKPMPRLLIFQNRFHIGDALWLTPLLRAISAHPDEPQVTYIGPPPAARLFAWHPVVTDVFPYLPGETSVRRKLNDDLLLRHIDAALLFFARRHESDWLVSLLQRIRVPTLINLEYFEAVVDPRLRATWSTHEGWCFWSSLPSPRMMLHALDPMLPEGVEPDTNRKLEIFLPPMSRRRAAERLRARGLESEPFAVLTPGGLSSRLWPPEKFAALAARLADDFGMHVVIEGAPDEIALLQKVRKRARELRCRRPGQEDAEGRTAGRILVAADSLEVFAVVLGKAALLVSNDSAPIHLAEAAQTPTLYFAQQLKLVHSHPAGDRSWALFDPIRDDPSAITVEQALGAIEEMRRTGCLRE